MKTVAENLGVTVPQDLADEAVESFDRDYKIVYETETGLTHYGDLYYDFRTGTDLWNPGAWVFISHIRSWIFRI